MGVLCDDGCTGYFHKDYAIVAKNKKVVLYANRDPLTKLWYTDLNQPTAINTKFCTDFEPTTFNIANAVLPSTTIADTVSFIHAALFSPPVSMLPYL